MPPMIDMVTERLEGPDVWLGRDLQANDDWIVQLDDGDIAEIDAALAVAQSGGAVIPFGRELFPLEQLHAKLERVFALVTQGCGVALLRGLPRERYTPEACELIYWGIGSHLGTGVSQSPRGDMIGYVRDEGLSMGDPNARGYNAELASEVFNVVS